MWHITLSSVVCLSVFTAFFPHYLINGRSSGRKRVNSFQLATHCIRQFPVHFPSHVSPCANTFQLDSTKVDCVWNVMAHAQKPDFVFRRNGWVHINRRGASVQSTAGSRGVRISGSNAGYTMFRGSAKGTDYALHFPVSPSLLLPCVTMCHYISTGLYQRTENHRYKLNLVSKYRDTKCNYGEDICTIMFQLIIPLQVRSRGCTGTVYGPQFTSFLASVSTGNFSQTFL
jgi:hypothetical protein